jgi:hypothetical protein
MKEAEQLAHCRRTNESVRQGGHLQARRPPGGAGSLEQTNGHGQLPTFGLQYNDQPFDIVPASFHHSHHT